jgi:DNA-binding beta-propeller fold protein YncE
MMIRIFFIILITVVFSSTPALAVNITNIRHLFDITHDLADPSDVAVSENGNIYVLDGVNNRVKVFNNRGEYITSFGRKGSGEGEFRQPLGIDLGSSGDIYVADSGNHRVQILNPEGRFKAQIKIPPKNVPADPTDVAVDEKRNRCYVVDNDNHYLLVYGLDTLKLIDTYGSPGSEKRAFRYPFFITLDDKGYLYIVEVINTRVQVLNPEGLFVTFIGGWGVEKGEFFRPKGIAIDRNNRVYVSDSYLGVIQVFDNIGEFRSVLGDKQTGKVKKFKTPVGICVDKSNRLYVVEMFSDRIGVYSMENE